MPLYFKTRSRRKKNLREELLDKRIKGDKIKILSQKSNDTFLNSTPDSLKGSFLLNKLDNPLFKPIFGRRSKTSSSLSKVIDISDSEDDEEEGEESDDSLSIISVNKSVSSTSKTTVSKPRSIRFGSSFFTRRGNKKKHLNLHLSSSSSSSSSSSNIDSSEELEVETLTKYENDNEVENINQNNNITQSQNYLLYTHKGKPVRVKFCYDYLLISPVYYKLSLSRRRSKVQNCKTIYYEDLALWTNNDECLRLVHIKNKETALQERNEIKLFVSKKKRQITLKQINQELKDKISILVANKKSISLTEAQQLLNQNNTQADLQKVVQKIDRSAEKAIVRNYSNQSLVSQNFELLNV